MNLAEVKQLEIIQVRLMTDEDVEEPTFAKVMDNRTNVRVLRVLFLNDNGCLDRYITDIPYESVISYWPGETNIWDISGIEPSEEMDSDGDEDLEGFVVPDDEEDAPTYTNERRQFDNDWSDWTPDTPEGARFKNMVNHIEDKYGS